MSDKILRFVRDSAPATPYLVVDLDVVEERFAALARGAARASTCYYAVKANPAPEVLARAAPRLGCRFDVASPAEVDAGARRGRPARRASRTGTRSRRRATSPWPSARGVRLFADGLRRRRRHARAAGPGRRGLRPAAVDGHGADWPLTPQVRLRSGRGGRAARPRAADLGLRPAGVSFHVGSQQHDPDGVGPRAGRRPPTSSRSVVAARRHRPRPDQPRRRIPRRPARADRRPTAGTAPRSSRRCAATSPAAVLRRARRAGPLPGR